MTVWMGFLYITHLWIWTNSGSDIKLHTSHYFSSAVYGTSIKYKINTLRIARNSKF